jgi:acetyl-CoA C-acetyltransferase
LRRSACRSRPLHCPSLARQHHRCRGGVRVERIEINEAFAVIALAVLQELGLPPDIVNVEGGAIAHGHPIGATGAVLTTRLLHSMRRDGLKRGIVTMCIGGGQEIALALEMIA